nr:MAG TPA: hypothetical protein [Caudoviricetes sp.]
MLINPIYKINSFVSNLYYIALICLFVKLFYIVYLIKRTTFFSYNIYTSKLDYLNKRRYNLFAYKVVIHLLLCL